MTTGTAAIGMCFDRTFPPPLVVDIARRLDGRADQLWVVEDCFYNAGVSLAAAALAATESLTVGLGILPAVARNPAITAMELATLAGLAPGRLLPGIGHGVQDWMGQMGARPASPLTTLEEVLVAVGRLLAGERVTTHGRHVHLDDVRLDRPPAPGDVGPLLAGVRGPRSLAMAGRSAGGVVLAEPASPSYVRWALDRAGRPEGFHVAVFTLTCVAADRRDAYRQAAPLLAGQFGGGVSGEVPGEALRALPFYDEMAARHADRGVEGLATMPPDWWREVGAVGTPDDAAAHVAALEDAGAHSIGLFPPPALDSALAHLPHVVALAARTPS